MVIVKPNKRHLTNEVVLDTTDFVIKQVDKVKILGIYFTAGLSHTATVNAIISKVNFSLKILRNVFKYTSKRTSLMVMNACILSVFKYACPILIDSNIYLQQKLNTLLIKCTRIILGFKSYKWNVTTIMREMKWYTYYQILMIEGVTFLHKCLYEIQIMILNDNVR